MTGNKKGNILGNRTGRQIGQRAHRSVALQDRWRETEKGVHTINRQRTRGRDRTIGYRVIGCHGRDIPSMNIMLQPTSKPMLRSLCTCVGHMGWPDEGDICPGGMGQWSGSPGPLVTI